LIWRKHFNLTHLYLSSVGGTEVAVLKDGVSIKVLAGCLLCLI